MSLMTTDQDSIARGFTSSQIDSQRYGNYDSESFETPGIVQSLIPPGSRVLDVGCGNGQLTEMLMRNRQCEVLGIEPHAERAKVAIDRGLPVINGLFDPSTAPTIGLFDIVLFGDVLEHLSDPMELLLLARTVLKPNGSVVVSVPNIAHWSIRLKLLLGNFNYSAWGPMDATHLRWFTWLSLEKLLTAGGFSVTDQTVSAGTWLPIYNKVLPWKWFSESRRSGSIIWLTKKFPKLFGCQLVFKAAMSPSLP